MPIQFLPAFLRAISIVFSAFKFLVVSCNSLNKTHSSSALNSLHWLPIRKRIDYNLATLVHRSLHNACSQYLSSLLQAYTPTHQLRSASLNLLSVPRVNITLASRGFRHAGPSIWNSLPPHLRSIDTSLPSNPISKLTFSLLKAFLAPNNFIRAILIQHFYVDFSVENILLILWWCCALVSR